MGQKATLGDDVFERIVELIYNCELPPGSIVSEATLAARFGLSRGPIREAVRRLQGIQLVSRESFMRARVITLEPDSVRDLFGMRGALEGYACRLAAEKMPDDAIKELAQALDADRQTAKQSTVDVPTAASFDFHERIVRASGNQRIIDTLCGDLYHLLRMYRRWSGATGERKSLALTEHRQILMAVRNRDGELAESLMRSHIDRAADNILQSLPRDAGTASDSSAA